MLYKLFDEKTPDEKADAERFASHIERIEPYLTEFEKTRLKVITRNHYSLPESAREARVEAYRHIKAALLRRIESGTEGTKGDPLGQLDRLENVAVKVNCNDPRPIHTNTAAM